MFIGVTGASARLDNYVGCDRHGWAFLANRAVWHNKSKLKSYGELFRTGDTVTVVLDLDLGTLSFCLNGKDLGIAVEGLVGPLYPAFSLYNEDDQLSIVPPRASPDSAVWSASASERLLDRVEALHCLQAFFLNGYRTIAIAREQSLTEGRTSATSGAAADDTPRRNGRNAELPSTKLYGALSSSASPNSSSSSSSTAAVDLSISLGLAEELSRRWCLWHRGVGIRSTVCGSDFISIVMSPYLCASVFSGCRLRPGDALLLEGSRARVLGAACHRLWIQFEATGEVCGKRKEKGGECDTFIFTPRHSILIS